MTAMQTNPMSAALATVPELLAELSAGRMVILVDDEDRENEGDLVIAADHVSPEAINFMAKNGRKDTFRIIARERKGIGVADAAGHDTH